VEFTLYEVSILALILLGVTVVFAFTLRLFVKKFNELDELYQKNIVRRKKDK